MKSWLSSTLLLALATVAYAQNDQISITASNDTSNISTSSEQIVVGLNVTNTLTPVGTIWGLSAHAASSLPSVGYLSGSLFLATTSTQLQLTNREIAFISCDATDYVGLIQATDVFATAIANNVLAILFYSQQAAWCNLSAPGSTYNEVYSMTSMKDSQSLLSRVSGSSPATHPAVIGYEDSVQNYNASKPLAGNPDGGSANQTTGLGPSPSTAVAMIILYSITGLITALFLIIIITGAVRAHRHPERYGPRNILGRPRQSRAKGLARAMLEGLPIVKFGEDQPVKPADVELADHEHGVPEITGHHVEGTGDSEEVAAKEATPRLSTSASSGIGPAGGDLTPGDTTNADKEMHLGCSICTDDFEQGQDLRVLPCNHKFHPACIDPWLLNVSGTCPLCRINLNPATEEGADAQPGDETAARGLPPPLPESEVYRNSIGRSLLISFLRVGQSNAISTQDRTLALNRLRASEQARRDNLARQQARGAPVPAGSGEIVVDESRRRRRFRDAFGIRTRTRGQNDDEIREETEAETLSAAGPATTTATTTTPPPATDSHAAHEGS